MEPLVIIILIAAASLLLVAGIVFLLYFTVLRHIWAKKQVGEMSRRFEYLHALLFGQDSQYIRRIENISSTNLLYADTYIEFKKRYKEVRDQEDTAAQTAVNKLKDLLSERHLKALKEELPKAKKALDNYDREVNKLNDDLLTVIKPEEDCRQQSLIQKEELRKVKQDYYVKQADISLASDSFEFAFKMLDDKFKEFESRVETAQYSEASEMLPYISAVLKQLSNALKEMPDLCVTIQSVIPDKLDSLENRFEELTRAGYPLYHLLYQSNIDEMREQLNAISEKVKNFDLDGTQQELDGILAKIDEYFDSFEKEKNARVRFENECEDVYNLASEVEKKYVRLCHGLPEIRKYYVISEAEEASLNEIQEQINRAGATKRSLDTYVHSNTQQPYSMLLEKMTNLKNETEKSDTAIEEFTRYLYSLKSDADEAASLIQKAYFELNDDEAILRNIATEEVTQLYQPRINHLHEVIDSIYKAMVSASASPIDVDQINGWANELRGEMAEISKDLGNLCNLKQCATTAILYGNRRRVDYSDLASSLKQAEGLYFQGKFRPAYDEASAAIKRIRGEE